MTLIEKLEQQLALAGLILLEAELKGDTLEAVVDETYADEPLCPLAFDRVVGALSFALLGARLSGMVRFVSNAPTIAAATALPVRQAA